MFNAFFDWGAISQYITISLIIGAAITIFLIAAPIIAISIPSSILIGLASSGVIFVACMMGFGGKGFGSGEGDGKGKGNIEQQSVEKKPIPKIDNSTLTIVINGNNYFVGDDGISFEDVKKLIKQKILNKKLNKIIFYYKTGYKAQANEQTKLLAKQYYNHKIIFERKYEE